MRGKALWLCSTLAVLAVAGCTVVHPKPQAVRAIYRVQIAYELAGIPLFHGTPETLYFPSAGSGTAISADGDLLTARHVADVIVDAPELCLGMVVDFQRMLFLNKARVESVQLRVTGPDGKEYNGRATMASEGPTCDASGRLRLVWDARSTATITAIDDTADLTLLHINATGIKYLELERTAPKKGDPVVSAGFAINGMTIRNGDVVEPCFMHGGPLQTPVPLLQISQLIRPGMSGGPVASGNRLLGINVMMQMSPPYDSYAVPATYAAAWYDWVRTAGPVRPPVQCH